MATNALCLIISGSIPGVIQFGLDGLWCFNYGHVPVSKHFLYYNKFNGLGVLYKWGSKSKNTDVYNQTVKTLHVSAIIMIPLLIFVLMDYHFIPFNC